MAAVVDAVVTTGTSAHTKESNPVAMAAVRMSLLGQDPEAYAKACSALAGATQKLDIENVSARTLIITGAEDRVSPPEACLKMSKAMKNCEVVTLKDVGHWHIFEDARGVAGAVDSFLKLYVSSCFPCMSIKRICHLF
jgi:pimeloyl-ACP methyl ester carboxylesterase